MKLILKRLLNSHDFSLLVYENVKSTLKKTSTKCIMNALDQLILKWSDPRHDYLSFFGARPFFSSPVIVSTDPACQHCRIQLPLPFRPKDS